jgi:alpha-L-fucosidase 2
MADHLWEHYRFTRDEAYLREVFPVLKGAVDFITTFACYDEKVGYYVTAPSGNPENKFIVPGGSSTRNTFDLEERAKVSRYSPDVKDLSCVSKITTLDLTMITNLLATYKQACAVLGETVKPEATALAENLPPFQIGSRGQLQEWEEDFGECTPGMPHLSPLLGVYPENVITPDQPRLYEAARIAFERRVRNGDYYGQWPGAWNLCMNARFKNATGCYMNERFMGSDLGASLLNVGYYQIDAVMGWAAGLTEMLLQSYMEYHDILPAIPSGWREGSVRGMVARGGVEYSVSWAEGVLSEFSVHCASDRTQEIRYHDHSIVVNLTGGVARRVVFDASANGGSGELRVQSNS